MFFYEGLPLQNFFTMFLFSMRHPCLLTHKITADINDSIKFLIAVQDLGDSLHGRRKFKCLIMVSKKLM